MIFGRWNLSSVHTSENLCLWQIAYHGLLHFPWISSLITLNVVPMSAFCLLNLVPMSAQSVQDLVLVAALTLLHVENVPVYCKRSFVMVSAQNTLYREHMRRI